MLKELFVAIYAVKSRRETHCSSTQTVKTANCDAHAALRDLLCGLASWTLYNILHSQPWVHAPPQLAFDLKAQVALPPVGSPQQKTPSGT